MSTKLNISFEFYPPKTAEGHAQLHETALALVKFAPQFFSVTFGAGGSTRKGTLETVTHLQEHTPISLAPHLACIGAEQAEIIEILQQYQNIGIQRVVALRGDLPSGMGKAGQFKFANELVSLIRKVMPDDLHISVAAYPEMHPQANTMHEDVLNLKRKYEAGANSAITQYFFNSDAYFYYLDDCAKHGVNLPIIPGIMPITQFNNLARFSDTCGAEIPRFIRKRLESYGDDLNSIQAFGIEVVTQLCERLMSGGAPGLHFYTLNKAKAVSAVLKMLGSRLGNMVYA